jgi:hypothetical protein
MFKNKTTSDSLIHSHIYEINVQRYLLDIQNFLWRLMVINKKIVLYDLSHYLVNNLFL